MGSMIMAAVFLEIISFTELRSLNLAFKINSGSGPNPSLNVSESPSAMFSNDLP